MTESEFRRLWESEKPAYNAWGGYVILKTTQELLKKGKNLDSFLKTPAKHRLKDDNSLIDKAFYRPGKSYSDPYRQIEDKVGVRFIVLLLDDITEICEIIQNVDDWDFDACKHFDKDKETSPLLFTYQSVHYILRPKKDINSEGVTIPESTSCEVQIRTLLQHAHAELTHDAIYKAKRIIQPIVHRTVAKSMALIETTDGFFTDVTHQLNDGPLEKHAILKKLDNLYFVFTGLTSCMQKSSLVIWDVFEQFIDDSLIDSIQKLLDNNPFLSETIKSRYSEHSLYQQSTALFIYWLLKKKKQRLLSDWPLSKSSLESFAVDLGISTWAD
ncbi:GTP pyrophosphokinase [Methylovulum psychrotolerans]|uniref:(P)ppGpp synthetase n=1 Tax=Methylovulum psychrotolerans TaxID=1704499 RepID=A0A1Z4BZU7_9GAMM|nr:(p)ppGpp synthetase [Methylovulum psychrotolerans]ASF46781.1 (p)ppGpp synthetase [Methylovulum psychrotolerans]